MSDTILSKEEFQGEFFVSVRQYILFGGHKTNRLALRLRNDMHVVVTGVRLCIERKDKKSLLNEKMELDVNGLAGRANSVFSIPDIALPSDWKDIQVHVRQVMSGKFCYSLTNDGESIAIDARFAPPIRTEWREDRRPPCNRLQKRYRGLLVLLILAIFGITLAASWTSVFPQQEVASCASFIGANGEEYVKI